MRARPSRLAAALTALAGAGSCQLDLNRDLLADHPQDAGSEAAPDASGGSGAKDAGDAWASGGGGNADAAAGAGGTAGSDACVPKSEICDNGGDDDCDGKVDCDDPDCELKTCATDSECRGGSCQSVYVSAKVACSNSGETGTNLCQAAGWQGCTDSVGYWWFQCAGPGECPDAWAGLDCASYATATDCVGASLATSDFHVAPKGCDGAYGATDFGYDCTNYNPGYTVRLSCF